MLTRSRAPLPLLLARARRVVAATALALPALAAQTPDSVTTFPVAPGVTHVRFVRLAGPWVVNVLTVDLRSPGLGLRQVRAHDQLRTRERTSEMVRRREASGETVLAAVNADFFDLRTGENENNQVLDGEWWKGVKVTDSPFGTFDTAHAQFGLDSLRRPLLDRFAFDAEARGRRVVIPLITLNAAVHPAPEGAALFTWRYGAATPRDTGRAVAEAPLAAVGRRADTALYARRGPVAPVAGSAIPERGAVLAGYGARAQAVAEIADGETLKVVLRAAPRAPDAAPLALLIGGWPRIVRDGRNVATHSAADEGTISRNAEVRHPRTAIGFNHDSSTLVLVTVDGRSTKSVGMTLVELADLMLELGAHQALNFDGGGSTTMVVQNRVVNSPSDPTGEREVGNALLVVSTALPRAGAAVSTVGAPSAIPALDSAQLLSDLSALAADSMEGRRIGTPGGVRARAYLVRALGRIALAPAGDSFAAPFTARLRSGSELNGANVVGLVRGAAHADRYVVLSAHYDHLGIRNNAIYHGADDNASGTAGVLAIAHWLRTHPPDNSVLVALFDGEESGLLGAKAFLEHPPVPVRQIVANVNLDMVSRNERGELYAAGATPYPVLRPLLDSVAALAPVKLRLGHDAGSGPDNWIQQSDQGAFHDRGIPFVYFGVEDHPDYHRPTDDFERIQPGFYYRSVQTIAAFVLRLDRALDRVAAVRAGR